MINLNGLGRETQRSNLKTVSLQERIDDPQGEIAPFHLLAFTKLTRIRVKVACEQACSCDIQKII